MDSPFDWGDDSGDYWEHGISSDTSHPVEFGNAVSDSATHFGQIPDDKWWVIPALCLPPVILTLTEYSSLLSTDDCTGVIHGHAVRRDTPPPSLQETINIASTEPCRLSKPDGALSFSGNSNDDAPVNSHVKPRCWDHGCNGREFSSRSNFVRHKKEREGEAAKVLCPLCDAVFSRASARDTHLTKQSCNRIRRYSNGRPRPSKIALLSSLNLAQGTQT